MIDPESFQDGPGTPRTSNNDSQSIFPVCYRVIRGHTGASLKFSKNDILVIFVPRNIEFEKSAQSFGFVVFFHLTSCYFDAACRFQTSILLILALWHLPISTLTKNDENMVELESIQNHSRMVQGPSGHQTMTRRAYFLYATE